MASERFWSDVPATNFISDGGTEGQVQVLSTRGMKVKMKVVIKSTSPTASKSLEIKKVVDLQNIVVGPRNADMRGKNSTVDVSMFTVASGALVMVESLERPAIFPNEIIRSVYEEEPSVALRTIAVDEMGNKFTVDNPFPVQLSNGSIDIGTVNAQLETFLTHKDNDPDNGDVHSSIRIGDGTDLLAVNPDGSLNVVLQTSGSDTVVSTYNEVSSVPSGSLTTIATFTAGVGVNSFLSKIDYSGDNVAKFTVELNGNVIDKQRTYFGSELNGTFSFSESSKGLKLLPGDIVTLRVIHSRLSSGDFNGRIQVVES